MSEKKSDITKNIILKYNIGEQLTTLRDKMGLKQEDVASRFPGCYAQKIHRIEKTEDKKMVLGEVEALAREYNTSLAKLLKMEETTEIYITNIVTKEQFLFDKKILDLYGIKESQHLVLFQASDNSMFEYIETGKICLVNKNFLLKDGLFLLHLDNQYIIRKLELNSFSQTLSIIASSKEFNKKHYSNIPQEQIQSNIIGEIAIILK